ncbi:hypothetical protein MPSEU_000607100 [Mayamaea pseudoterrestris]|nr:hypothetical protein MPSEU_000607100 [Mayamaea pseudoterrestris]
MAIAELAGGDAMDLDDVDVAPSSFLNQSQSHLSTMQQQDVDRVFEQLFGYKWGTQFDLGVPETRQEILLCRMLGKRAAATVLHTKSKSKRVKRISAASEKPSSPIVRPPLEETLLLPRAATGPTALNRIEPVEIAAIAAAPIVATSGNVDSVLKALEEGQGTSTIAKTSADWEVFKDQTGLGDKLEEKAEGKDAFLNRQAFLTRVDHRTFELERKDRDKERTKRGT